MTAALRWIFMDGYGDLRIGWCIGFVIGPLLAALILLLSASDTETVQRLDNGCVAYFHEDVRFFYNTVEKTSGVYCAVPK